MQICPRMIILCPLASLTDIIEKSSLSEFNPGMQLVFSSNIA